MKKQLYILILVLSNISFGQNNSLTDSVLKPGIYLTVEQISNNRPIEIPNLKIKKDSVKYGTLGNIKYMDAYSLDISKENAKKIGRILGFSDGKDIYLTPISPSSPKGASFHKVEKICHFLYFNGIREVKMSQQNLYWLTDCQNLIDLRKNELISILTNGKIKKIISDNPELLKKFKNEDKKHLLYKEYLKEYCIE